MATPRITVGGINPQCGEVGLFGTKQEAEVVPAVAAARSEGIEARGPVPGDTVHHRAHPEAFELVVAQHHDQGHVPIKLMTFDTAVNVSLGLPIDRVSVDHGTACDVAGTGQADHVNLRAALASGWRLAQAERTLA